MKIAVIGAGAIGSAIARDLVARDAVTLVQVCDAHARLLQRLHDTLENPVLRSFQIDARDTRTLATIVREADVVVGCAAPELNPRLARMCLELGIHFCDLGGDEATVNAVLAMNEEARARSVWLVPNCGLAPGLVNVLSRAGIEQFDEVDVVRLRVGDVPLHPEPPFNFRLAWSASKILDDYTAPVRMIEAGRVIQAEPLAHRERLFCPEPFGEMEAFCTAGGLTALVDDLADRVNVLDHKTIRWPGHADQMQFVIGLGFAENRKIDVKTHLTYRDVLIRRMRSRLGGAYEDAVLLRVLIKGRQAGAERTLIYEMVERHQESTGLTAIQRATGIPTATVACLLSAGRLDGGGAAPADKIVPAGEFLERLNERGLVISTRWMEGYVPVTSPDLLQPVSS